MERKAPRNRQRTRPPEEDQTDERQLEQNREKSNATIEEGVAVDPEKRAKAIAELGPFRPQQDLDVVAEHPLPEHREFPEPGEEVDHPEKDPHRSDRHC